MPDNTAETLRRGEVDRLADRPRNATSEFAGPRAALRRLRLEDLNAQERATWRENARIDAILGSCRLSMPSVRSGIRSWITFIGATPLMWAVGELHSMFLPDSLHQGRVRYFPPACEDILAWSTLFRSSGTWCNYLNYLRTACMLVKASTEVSKCCCHVALADILCPQVFAEPAVRRTTVSVQKAGNFVSRERMWIRMKTIEQLMALAEQRAQLASVASLFLITYIFLLRLPSEALPLTVGQNTSTNEIFMDGGCLVVVLARRKNKANGSKLTRRCWCARSRPTCPVHVVGRMLGRFQKGARLFAGWTPSSALGELRSMLEVNCIVVL